MAKLSKVVPVIDDKESMENSLPISTDSQQKPETNFWRMKTKQFLQSIACTGAQYIGSDSEPIARRVLWVLLLLLGVIAVTMQVAIQVQQYISRPTTVDIREKFVPKLKFPAITICPESRYHRFKARAVHPDMEKALDEIFPPFFHYGLPGLSNSTINVAGDISADWNQIYYNMSGNPKEIIFTCAFKGGPCGPYREVWTPMGLCFTFNSDGNWTQDGGGVLSGLGLMLNMDQYNHIVLNDFTSGFQMIVHEPYEFPAMLQGFKVDVGKVTTIKLKKTEMKLLKAPYGDCDSRPLRDYDTYTRANCEVECLAKGIEANCSCSYQGLPAYNFNRTCNLLDEAMCVLGIIRTKDKLGCDCPVQCNPTTYSESISSSTFATAFVNYVSMVVTKGAIPPWQFQNNFVTALLYFPELAYSEFKVAEAYSFIDLVCDMGGALGLMLGSTFFTLYEFVDFFIWGYWEKLSGKIPK